MPVSMTYLQKQESNLPNHPFHALAQYGLYGFSCETFTSVCAEIDQEKANPCARVKTKGEDKDKVDEKRRAAATEYVNQNENV